MKFKELQTEQKLRGGYYTPSDLAGYLSKWIVSASPTAILEPSCGDGAFFDALLEAGLSTSTHVTGFELFEEEAAKARKRLCGHGEVFGEDFLGYAVDMMRRGEMPFDGVVGNPPFVRYQFLPEEFQLRAEQIFRHLNLKFTKHTNAWVPFILASVALLQPGGRLAMVVPAEIIHVTHAQSLRTYLGSVCTRLMVIDPEELWFDGTLQGAVLLLAEKKHAADDHIDGLGILPVRGKQFLWRDPDEAFAAIPRMNGRTVEGKWTRALLSAAERDLLDELREHKNVKVFDDVADVDVGIVTGANKFFLVPDEVVRQYELTQWAHPMFGRSEHCPGIVYDVGQHRRNASQGTPANFLWLKGKLNKKAEEYIKMGEAQKLHTRYKCRIRTPWYTVPSVYSTPVGMLKRSHSTPRLIFNSAGAYTTDTAYRITSRGPRAELLVYSFINALTSLSAELEGRHYGGGVLELVPSEIERLLLPVSERIDVDLLGLDKAVRTMPMEIVVEQQTRRTLGAIGLAKADQNTLLGAWDKMRNRRQRNGGDTEVEGNE